MLTIRLFGTMDVRDRRGDALQELLRQPKRLALLAYVAAEGPDRTQRDVLRALFWPESDTEHARHALNQALHFLRRVLADAAVVTRGGGEVVLNPELVACDLWAFERALASGELEAAVALYQGPFLGDLSAQASVEFEHWVDGARERLAQAHARALEQLALRAEERGASQDAVEWWRRRAEADPFSTRVSLRLMEVLEATGDRAAAIALAEQYAIRIREELEAEPSTRVLALAERMRISPTTVPPTPAQRSDGVAAALAPRYAIERQLGRGAMGVVYLARDNKHDRWVAVKVLRPELTATIASLRFLQEIRVTATLSHPHIVGLYDSGEAAGFVYYVMPYIDGETLRQRISREGPLPLNDALRITRDVAGALSHAHGQGVIHRDIKPENILLAGGEAVVTDFGIARAITDAGGEQLTERGISVGSPAYMSPEQVTGTDDVDARSDTYGLACVLYEMLGGETPYTGPTPPAILRKKLTYPPPRVTTIRETVPSHVDAALSKALARLAADRFEDIAAFADALADPDFAVPTQSPAEPGRRSWRRSAATILTLAAGAIGVGAVSVLGGADASRPARSRLEITLPDSAPLAPGGPSRLSLAHPAVAISPDGSTIAFVGKHGSTTSLYVRRLDGFESVRLPRTEGAHGPFFSPDGEWIGYFVGDELHKVAVQSGDVVTLADVGFSHGAVWSRDGRIYAAYGEADMIAAVAAGGGRLEVVLPRLGTFRLPAFVEDTRWMLGANLAGVLFATHLETGEVKRLGLMGANPRFLRSGHLLYLGASGLMAVPFDPRRVEVTGEPVLVLDDVWADPGLGAAHFAVSDNGVLVYAPGAAPTTWRLVVADPGSGTIEWLPFPLERRVQPDFSPRGTRVAASVWRGEDLDVWLYDLVSRRQERLTYDGGDFPCWTPAWTAVVYRAREVMTQFHIRAPAGEAKVFLDQPHPVGYPDFSRDGRMFAYVLITPDNNRDVWVADLTRPGTLIPIATTRFVEWSPSLSPDGRWIAYTSDETGMYHVYVQPVPPTGERWAVSVTDGAMEPVWSADGAHIYYRAGRRFVRVPVSTDGTAPALGEPEVVLEGPFIDTPARSFDVSLDGRLALAAAEQDPRSRRILRVVQGWFDELEERVGH
jgi:serine/threonine-protein kinase